MILENLKTNVILLNKNDFGNDLFLGSSSYYKENSINNKEKSLLLKKVNYFNTNDSSFYKSELIKYKQDIELIKQAGVLHFRFSLSWSRIIPDGIGEINIEAIHFYNDILDICIENRIEPMVSLFDSCLPTALKNNGGWSNRESLNWFEDYVAICVNAFKGKVTYWIVFNEPSVFTGASSLFEIYPSGKNKIKIFLSVLHHVLLCQSIGFKKIKKIVKTAHVGSFFSYNYCIPMTFSEKDLKAAERIDTLLNRIFIEPLLGLGYPIKSLPFLKNSTKNYIAGDNDLIKVDFDFIGLQNCTQEIVCHNSFVPYFNAKILNYDKLRVKKNHLSLENYHELISHIIKKYSEYDGIKKIIVDENNLTSIPNQPNLNDSFAIKSN
ncbi:family 1 glycosylhydrolase [Flavobacterium franklandianum]|uniref:Family 1 glycosylhydrolase n=1 Tax=Flavobacterium franklandianum TaxID=2594430 RepID=A0A553CK86_9FLAO|nr:family 1 glycosylhydrolase [Flavobacterium franklandianum]TRX20899.1 family 1 glycosylhydrolase [Flavobacterium franklandianum]